jgi:transglutaminase-like putative cysteine protease
LNVWARLTLAAAVAVGLTTSALAPLYDDLGWLARVLAAVAVVAGSAALARTARLPRALVPFAAGLGLAAYVVLVFAPGTVIYAVVPGSETARSLAATLEQGLLDMQELGAPVPTEPGLVLLAVLGVGAVAVVVDLLAAGLRRVAVAGLPLLLLFTVPSAVLSDGAGLLPFVLGATGWLILLLADGSDRVSRWGAPLSAATADSGSADPGLARVGRRIGAAALGVAVVVPALIPGLDGRLLGEGSGVGANGSRTTTTYNPITRLAGQLRLPEPVTLLTYRTTTGADYLRLTTLDVFDPAAGWSSSELSGDVDEDAVQQGIPAPQGQTTTATREVRTEITVSSRLDGPWLPVPFPPADIDIEGPWLWDAEAETVFSTRAKISDLDAPYVVSAAPVDPSAELLRRTPVVPDDIREGYAQPPAVSDYVSQLVARTTAGQTSDYDRVVALQALFRDPGNGFRYDQDASEPGINSPDALENFLRGRVGFCEQYASAMAAMVRSLGIPSRVAVGFIPGRAVGEDRYEVTTSDAHAWPEVWFTGVGWVRFEPTPRSGADTPAYSTPQAEAGPSAGPSAAPSAAPAVPQTAPDSDPGALDRAEQDGSPGAGGAADPDSGLAPVVLAAPLLLLVLAAPALLGAARRRHRWRTPDARAAWAVLHDDAVDVGHRWRPADSPRAAAAHLAASRPVSPVPAAALDRLTVAVERARYARPAAAPTGGVATGGAAAGGAAAGGADDRTEAAALRRDVAALRVGLLAASTAGERWRARVLPPSSLRWAGSWLAGTIADALDRMDLALSAVRLRLRPRGAAVSRSG